MRRVLLAALVTLCACSGGTPTDANHDGIGDGPYAPNDVSVIAPSTPVGNISGTVLDGDGAPLSGVSVAVSLDGVAAVTTDAAGHFAFKGLPAGSSVGLSLSKSGFTQAQLQTVIPSAAGNVPINDATAFVGPVHLLAADSSLTFSVIGYDGALLAATGVLQISPAYVLESNGTASFGGWTVARATAAGGVLTFTGVPALTDLARLSPIGPASLTLVVQPFDADGDGVLDYGGATVQLSAQSVLASPNSLSVILPPPSQGQGALEIVGSNCGSMVTGAAQGGPVSSLIQSSGAIHLVFNQPIDPASYSVEVTDDDGSPVSVNPTLSAGNAVLDFSGAFAPGHALKVTVSAIASQSRPAGVVSLSGTCFVAPTTAAPTFSATYVGPPTAPLVPGAVVHVVFDSVLGSETAVPKLAAYIDADLDGDALRQSVGEFDSARESHSPGFAVTVDPTKPSVFGGHFSRFYQFTYPATEPLTLESPGPAVRLFFHDANNPSDPALEWIDGRALNSNNPPSAFLVAANP